MLSPADLPDPEVDTVSPALQVDSLPAGLPGKPPVQGARVQFLVRELGPTCCN